MHVLRHVFLCLLLAAIASQSCAQHVIDYRIDSLEKLASRLPEDTGKARIYTLLVGDYYKRYFIRGGKSPSDSIAFLRTVEACQAIGRKVDYPYGVGFAILFESNFCYNTGRKPRSAELFQEACSVFKAANSKAGMAAAYFYKAAILMTGGTLDTRISLLDSSVKLAKEGGDLKREALAIKSIGDLHLQQGKFSLAFKELNQALEMQRGKPDEMMFTTDLLTYAYAVVGNHKEALKSAIATLDLSYKANDTTFIRTYYSRLAGIYFDMGNYEKSFMYYRKAFLSNFPNPSDQVKMVDIAYLTGMAKCLVKEKRYAEALTVYKAGLKEKQLEDMRSSDAILFYLDIYNETGNYPQAEKYVQDMYKYFPELNIAYRAEFYNRTAQLYFNMRNFDKATRYRDSTQALADTLQSRELWMQNSFTSYLLDSAKGNYPAAIMHYREYKRYSDSVQKDIAGRQAAELAVQYETDQKNSELSLLNSRAALQQETISQGRRLRNIMIVASALLVLLLVVIFSRYRVKQRANKALQGKQDEINQQNRVLEKMVEDEKKITAEKDKLLQEKDWLMREINHRVKNNLQVVMSLLHTQTAYLKDEAALSAIQESQHRIHAISLIHRKLYQSDRQLTVIDMGVYIKEVTEYLADSLDDRHRVGFGLYVDPIELDVVQAVPAGLIINEAVTNSVKYAFPDGRKGQINIYLFRSDIGEIELHIVDNGVGLPDHFDWQLTESLGMSLMRGLTRQLDGRFEVIGSDGVMIRVVFCAAPVMG